MNDRHEIWFSAKVLPEAVFIKGSGRIAAYSYRASWHAPALKGVAVGPRERQRRKANQREATGLKSQFPGNSRISF